MRDECFSHALGGYPDRNRLRPSSSYTPCPHVGPVLGQERRWSAAVHGTSLHAFPVLIYGKELDAYVRSHSEDMYSDLKWVPSRNAFGR